MDLNSYQLQAVSHGKGPARVLAGPGSGKTAVIIHRVRQLIESCKVPPASILTVTFSRAAAEEMRSRFARLSSGNAGFSTVHSLFFHILDQYSGNDTSRLIRESEVFQIFRRDLEQDFSLLQGPMQQIRDILQDISRAKNMSEHPENPLDYQPVNLTPELFRKYFTRYQEELQRRNAMDYDDILIRSYRIFQKDPACLAYWQRRFSYIQVDEFQDLNLLQYKLLRLLAAPHGNLFVVGDDDQCIYGFRGADTGMMHRFLEDFPDARCILLPVNYRCPREILLPSQTLISLNQTSIPKDIQSGCSRPGVFRFHSYPDETSQYQGIIRQMKHCRRSGIPWDQMAVLKRSLHSSAYMTQMLTDAGIPVQETANGPNTHSVILDIRAYLRCSSKEPAREDLLRIIGKPDRGILRTSLEGPCKPSVWENMIQFYSGNSRMLARIQQFRKQLEMIRRLTPYAAVCYILYAAGYMNYLKDYAESRPETAAGYPRMALALAESARPFSCISDFLKDLDQRSRFSPSLTGVQVLTMHASKGLEFAAVFLPDLNRGSMPAAGVSGNSLEEERRLLYVAMTRSSRYLALSCTETIHGKPAFPSPFLSEILK